MEDVDVAFAVEISTVQTLVTATLRLVNACVASITQLASIAKDVRLVSLGMLRQALAKVLSMLYLSLKIPHLA